MTRINIYYAGLDNYSLPLGDGEKLILLSSDSQVDYIKLLCLVSDHVIVPPSFYFYWAGTKGTNKKLSELMDLYQAGYVSSAVHSTMGDSKDFLEHKLLYGTAEEKLSIHNNSDTLNTLFSEIPLTIRDVAVQSSGFKDKIEHEIERGYRNGKYRDYLLNTLNSEPIRGGVIASRGEINELHYGAYASGLIGKHEFRKYYYTTNKCYYNQGAITYDSIISILDAHRYSILGKFLFETKHGIQLGYDPQIILGILNSFGINNQLVSALSVGDLRSVRESYVFQSFKKAYFEFSYEIQKINLLVGGLSKDKLKNIQILYREEFTTRYFEHEIAYNKKMNHWAFSEMTVFALALGATGFFVIPVIGAVLGFLPIVLWKTGLTPKLGGYVVDQMSESKTSFYSFISELKEITKQLQLESEKA